MKQSIVNNFAVIAVLAVLLFGTSGAFAQKRTLAKVSYMSQPVSKSEQEAIEKIIREYLLKNPSVIREAMAALQQQEEKEKIETAAANIKTLRAEIYSDADSPVVGNSKGDVTVVVFYDYFCSYCKKTLPALRTLTAQDASVKIIYKEFPIMGLQSLVAAKAALAAGRQGKFEAFHQAMLESDSASDEAVKAIADRLGLDCAKLQKDMNDPWISAAIDRNISLAASLNINGTPAYLVGDQFVPGAIESDALARIVASQRAKQATAKTTKAATGQR